MSPARPGRRRPAPASGPAVWTAAELSPADWMIPLGTEDAADIAAALEAIAAAAPEPPMPRAAALFAALRSKLAEGRGFALLRGLAPEGVPGGAGALLDLLGRQLGTGVSVAGTEALADEAAPGFEAGPGLRAVLALRPAAPLTLVSAGALHNAMLLRDRALLAELYEPLGEEAGAESIFRRTESGFAGVFAAGAAPRARQRAALELLIELAQGAEHAFRLEMRAGDLLCLDTGRVWLGRLARTSGEPAFLLAPI